MSEINGHNGCGYKNGVLPSCAPLAVSYVPAQQNSLPQYEPQKALARGTLFPGLDLPLGNIANGALPDSPMAELMAIDFAVHDLGLYLDTHPDDREAFAVYQELQKMAEDGRKIYERKYGPLMKCELVNFDKFVWLNDPWPWDGTCCKEGR